MLWRPEIELRRKPECRVSVCIGRSLLPNAGFGNLDRDLLRLCGAIELYPSRNFVYRALCELDEIVANECLRHIDQVDVALDAAVIPPVCVDARDAVRPACVVYFHDDEVLPVADRVGHFEIEGRESAFVLAELGSVQIHPREIVRATEMQERSRVFALVIQKRPLVPRRSFIEKQVWALRVPVA